MSDRYNQMDAPKKKTGRPKGSKTKRLPVFKMPEGSPLAKPPRDNPTATELLARQRAKVVAYSLALSRWPEVDLFDPEDTRRRVDEFFYYSGTAEIIPTLPSYCLALGLDKSELTQIRTQTFYRDKKYYNLPIESVKAIQDGYDMLAQNLEIALLQGLVNNIGGIFIAKNNFEYKDENNYTITPGRERTDTEEIMRRYQVESDSQDE